MTDKQISVEVVYGNPNKQSIVQVVVEQGATVEQVIRSSGILRIYDAIDLAQNKVGIWNRTCKLSDVVKNADRIEIYRPLIADPKQVRRLRAERAKLEGRANKVTGGRANTNSKTSEP